MRSSIRLVSVFFLMIAPCWGQKDQGEQAPSLAKAARAAYECTLSAYMAGNIDDVEQVYVWSKRWMKADESATAQKLHLARMQGLQRRVAELHKVAQPGGEPAKLHATQYYVLEAKAMLAGS